MNVFRNYNFTWWQVGLIKLALLAIGIAVGANWPEVFVGYIGILAVGGFVLGIYLALTTISK